MIVANGCPRTGTHLVMKFLGMLGFEDSRHVCVRIHPRQPTMARILMGPASKQPVDFERIHEYGNDYFAHGHVIAKSVRDFEDLHIVINTYRDPRDSAVSIVKWHKRRKKLPKEIQSLSFERLLEDLLIRGYYGCRYSYKHTWVRFVTMYEGWKKADGLCLEFKDLGTFGAAEAIAEAVGFQLSTPDLEELCSQWKDGKKTFGDGEDAYHCMSSYNPEPSKWEDVWTPEIEKVWEQTGGNKLLRKMGYV